MKKFLATLLVATPVFAGDTELKAYWDRLFTEIRECVIQQQKTDTTYAPTKPIQNTSDLKIYLKALDYRYNVVYIPTKDLTEQEVCYLLFRLKMDGYIPRYLKPAEIIVIGDFQREADAKQVATTYSALILKANNN